MTSDKLVGTYGVWLCAMSGDKDIFNDIDAHPTHFILLELMAEYIQSADHGDVVVPRPCTSRFG